MILIVDCEEGNKKVMLDIFEELKNGIRDSLLLLVILIFDSVYVGKSFKVGFVNWYLKL